MTKALTRKRAECVERIKTALDAGRGAYLALADAVLDFDECEGWLAVGEESKTDFLRQADIDIGYSQYYHLLGVGRLARAMGVESIAGIPAYRVERGILPAVRFSEDGRKVENAEEVGDLLSDARALSREDFFIRARQKAAKPEAHKALVEEGETVYGAEDAPVGNVRRVSVSADGERHTLVLSVASADLARLAPRAVLSFTIGG